MNAAMVIAAVLTTAGFPLLLWAIGRGVTAAAARHPAAGGASRQYLAGRLYGLRITAVVAYDDELLITLGTSTGGEPPAGVFRVTAGIHHRARAQRWQRESTPLRGYLSQDGAIMLADPVLGGNTACQPAATAAPHHQPPPGNQRPKHRFR